MKKFLILLAAVALIGCEKTEDTTLSQEDQEWENFLLIGTWRENSKEPVTGRRNVFILTEDFKFTNYSFLDVNGIELPESRIYSKTDEPYIIPVKGTISFTRLENNTKKYELKDGILYITDVFTIPCEKIK